MQKTFDRATEDLGNSLHMEHVNVQIPDQRLSTLFYVAGLGLTAPFDWARRRLGFGLHLFAVAQKPAAAR